MSLPLADRVADALLFEGYMLYPYRPSAVKNRQRFNFGVVYPAGSDTSASEGADSHLMRTECLAEGDAHTAIDVKVRFLQLVQRTVGRLAITSVATEARGVGDYAEVDTLQVEDRIVQPWQEAVERAIVVRAIALRELVTCPRHVPCTFAASESLELVRDASGTAVGVIVRRQRTIDAELDLSATEPAPGLFKIRAQIRNVSSPDATRGRDGLLLHSLVSAHTILSVSGGAFVSLLDPPDPHRAIAAGCRGWRTWPVLVGEAGQRDTMLSSPIIIYDYPLVAPESAGDLFDGTEIDEILSLRILTMTDGEKREMRQSDERARLLLERTESLDRDQLMRMHGTMRELHPSGAPTA